MSTDTDTIPPNRADEYFAANPTEEKEVYWNHLKLSTVDWDRLEITAPEIYRSIIGEYIRIFLPDHGITSIRLNMINYSKMSQKCKSPTGKYLENTGSMVIAGRSKVIQAVFNTSHNCINYYYIDNIS